ncbi:MAG TPA: 2-aminoethylphosphonate--pyruvate transaminase [Verrucomicrobiota bacterium]|nr:2-aminoethylphosphonate--pyruvate transaminase [Verrucomicrobiota bacterium]HNT15396.1 2-aminoethylphosphonate--pyruvate transaminase [Verrucomicrobiota bacterium]
MNTDRLLFTPGPLTTSPTVKQAMQHDAGSRDPRFIAMIRDIRERLLQLGGVSQAAGYEAILLQGSGTFGVESVISSAIPTDGKILILINGVYGERMATMAGRHGLAATALRTAENQLPDLTVLDHALTQDQSITHVAAVHCETTTGILNPIEKIGALVRRHRRRFIVDAMSSFGAVPLDLTAAGMDYLISSANKCIEGVPGFSFVLARREVLSAIAGRARTLSLDLFAQWQGLEQDGQFRFTPPTHALLAFDQALRELEAEGGVTGRGRRYAANHQLLVAGMRKLGFRPYLTPETQSYIITTFHYPTDPRFRFAHFYQRLFEKGFVIYPGKLTRLDCFRIGNIGRIGEAEIQSLLTAIAETLHESGLPVPLPA